MAGFVLDAMVRFAMTMLSSTETLLNKAIRMLNVFKASIPFLLVKQVVHTFCQSKMRVTDPKTTTEKGGFALPPCLQLAFIQELEKYSYFWHCLSWLCHT
jgi:hypothetical protein